MRHAWDMEDLHDISSVPPKATKGSKKELFTRQLHLTSLKALLMLVAEFFAASVGWKVPCSTC